MLNALWGSMLLVAIIFGAFSGRMPDVARAAMEGAGAGVSLLFGMVGVMCFWTGLMEIAEKSGIVRGLSSILRPITHLIFPRLSPKEPAIQAIIMNVAANMLGMGNAATPFGLRAMQLLDEKNGRKKTASNEMCMLVLLNTASLQLLPTTLLLLRQNAGSREPAAVLLPIWIVSAVSLFLAVCSVKLLEKRGKYASV